MKKVCDLIIMSNWARIISSDIQTMISGLKHKAQLSFQD